LRDESIAREMCVFESRRPARRFFGAVASYVGQAAQSFALYVADVRQHPGSAIQDSLGLGLALASPGARMTRADCGNWYFIADRGGFGPWLVNALRAHAFTLGNVTVANRSGTASLCDPASPIYYHEPVHYRQSTAWGLFFIPAYLLGQVPAMVKHDPTSNPFEATAYAYGARRASEFVATSCS
jgi:hypothetical protein